MNPAPSAHGSRAIRLWLYLSAAMVFAMVLLGGATRLTDSGLSIVEWQPLLGAIPPLDQADWEAAFERYRAFPEYQKVNRGMSLDEFKAIYWMEYLHRLWGRLIGLVFLVPFLAFWFMGRLDGALARRLLAIFVAGGLQGALGWYMVQSGLVDRPDVSPYRLAAHLGLAVLIYGAILWTAWGLATPRGRARAGGTISFAVLVFITMTAGAFVAGLDAGLVYNTFPLMDGRLFPAGYWELAPFWRNGFENITAVQFNHRWIAIATLAAALWMGWRLRGDPPALRRAGWFIALAALVQVALGIATLLYAVPLTLGVLHQAGAMVLFTAALWAAHVARATPAP